MFTKDPRRKKRERIILTLFLALLVAVFILRKDLDRRFLAWKVAHGYGGWGRLFEIADRGPVMLPYIEPYLESDDLEVQWRILTALKNMKDPACAPAFRRLARHADVVIRRNALHGLAEIGDRTAIPLLIEGLSEEDLGIRRICSEGLEKLTGETHGFDPRAPEEERAAAVERWKAWYGAHDERLLDGR